MIHNGTLPQFDNLKTLFFEGVKNRLQKSNSLILLGGLLVRSQKFEMRGTRILTPKTKATTSPATVGGCVKGR